jgi:signal transduction histidine kinase
MNMQKEKILHVDDDEANRYTVRLILERAGYDVVDAANGREGLRLADTKPDLIILDIRLPDIDGFEVCRVIKSRPELSSIPVLQTSATFITSEDKVEGLDSGADGYLSQPIDNAVLVATVRSLLRTKTAERLAREAKRAQEEILAIVSHDLRNPLSAVMLQSKIVKKGIEKGDDVKNLYNHLDRIQKSCHRMNKLIEDLLIVTNIEQGRLTLHQGYFSVNDLIDEVMMSFEDLASQKQIRLVRKLSYKEELQLNGDRDRIFQVFANLISNAMRFTPPQGLITVGADANEAGFVFTVKDNGSGIPESSLNHIFDRYWQGHKDRSTGVGLGLSIVKGIVEAHSGSVWAESTLGEGATFSFMLPR